MEELVKMTSAFITAIAQKVSKVTIVKASRVRINPAGKMPNASSVGLN